MKSWFTKFRISAACDAGRPLPQLLRRKIAGSEELLRFEQSTQALDHALKGAPLPETPPWLHQSIIAAVRRAAPTVLSAQLHDWIRRRWVAGSAVAALIVACVWWAQHQGSQTREVELPLSAAATGLEMSDKMAQQATLAMTTPLTEELDRLGQDLDSTKDLLLASLP